MKGWLMAGLGLGIGTAAYLLHRKFKPLKTFSDKLESEITGRIHKINLTTLELALDVILKNPTRTEVSIQQPFIKIAYKYKEKDSSGKEIEKVKQLATSTLENKPTRIKAFGQSYINDIRIPVKLLDLGALAPLILKRLTDSAARINLVVTVQSIVDTGVGSFSYDKSQDILV